MNALFFYEIGKKDKNIFMLKFVLTRVHGDYRHVLRFFVILYPFFRVTELVKCFLVAVIIRAIYILII